MKPSDLLKIVDESGSEVFDIADISQDRLKNLAGNFFLKVQKSATDNKVVASGKMISQENFKYTITKQPDGETIIDLFMVYYADFVNKGVRGVKSSKNAPNSPYKFKNYGMSADGRKSILEYVTSGKAIISDISKTKYGKVGFETKASKGENTKSLNERQAENLIYLIKRYGIKETRFIDEAWESFKRDFGDQLKNAIFKAV